MRALPLIPTWDPSKYIVILHSLCLILPSYLLSLYRWIKEHPVPPKVFPFHIDGRDLIVFIGCIVIYSFVYITAGAIDRNLIRSIPHPHTSPLNRHRIQDVKKLTDAL